MPAHRFKGSLNTIMIILQMVCLIQATARSLSHNLLHGGAATVTWLPVTMITSQVSDKSIESAEVMGSLPPRCAHKCGRCAPCEAAGVPASSSSSSSSSSIMNTLKFQYTNYVPEGWKCKCGSSIFNP